VCAEEDDALVSPVNIDGLSPQDAVTKLQAQNVALTRHVNRLSAVKDENAGLRDSLASLQQQNRALEEELSKKATLFRASQAQHRYVLTSRIRPTS
jgi:hypothetical protein